MTEQNMGDMSTESTFSDMSMDVSDATSTTSVDDSDDWNDIVASTKAEVQEKETKTEKRKSKKDQPALKLDDSEDVTDDEDAATGDDEKNNDSDKNSNKIKLKVNREEKEYTQEEVIEMAQKYAAGSVRLEDVKAREKQLKSQEEMITTKAGKMKAFMNAMAKSHPAAISTLFEQAGVSLDDFVMFRARELYQESKLSPEERRVMTMERELRAKEQKLKAEELRSQRTAYEAQVKAAQERLSREIPVALEAAGLPTNDPKIVRRIVEKMRDTLDDGETPNAGELAKSLASELREERLAMLKSMRDEELEAVLGKKLVKPSEKKPTPTKVASRDNLPGRNKTSNGSKGGYIGLDEWLGR